MADSARSHIDPNFPADCIQAVIAKISAGEIDREMLSHVFVIIAWFLAYAGQDPDGFGDSGAVLQQCIQVVKVCGYDASALEDPPEGFARGPLVDLAIKMAIDALLQYIDERGGLVNVIKDLLNR